MKFSELKEAIRLYAERPSYDEGDDMEVVVETRNGGVPTWHKQPVKSVSRGHDWERGKFIIKTELPLVAFKQAYTRDIEQAARARLEWLKAQYAKIGQKYIAKAREEEWVDGFIEGFRQFNVEVADVGKTSDSDS